MNDRRHKADSDSAPSGHWFSRLLESEPLALGTDGRAKWLSSTDDSLAATLVAGLRSDDPDNGEAGGLATSVCWLASRLVDALGVQGVIELVGRADEGFRKEHLPGMGVPFQRTPTAPWVATFTRHVSSDPGNAVGALWVLGSHRSSTWADVVGGLARPGANISDVALLTSLDEADLDPLRGDGTTDQTLVLALVAAVIVRALRGESEFLEVDLHALCVVLRERDHSCAFLDVLAKYLPAVVLMGPEGTVHALPRMTPEAASTALEALSDTDRVRGDLDLLIRASEGFRQRGLLISPDVDGLDAVSSAFSLSVASERLNRVAVHSMLVAAFAHEQKVSASLGATEPLLRQTAGVSNADAAILDDLVRLAGPGDLAVALEQVRQRAATLREDAAQPADDLAALWRLVTNPEPDRSDISVWMVANREPSIAMLAGVAYGGDLSIAERSDTSAVRDPLAESSGTHPLGTDQGSASETSDGSPRHSRVDPGRGRALGLDDSVVQPNEGSGTPWSGGFTLPGLDQHTVVGHDDENPGQVEPAATAGRSNEVAESTDLTEHMGVDSATHETGDGVGRDRAQSGDQVPEREHDDAAPGGAGKLPGPPAALSEGPPDVPAPDEDPLTTSARHLIVGALHAGRTSAAYHGAAIGCAPQEPIWRFAVLSDAIARGSGPLAGAITDLASSVLVDGTVVGSSGQRGLIEVVYFAAVRASLIAPLSAAPSVMQAAARSLHEVEDFTNAVTICAQQGVAFIDDVLAQVGGLADAEHRLARATQDVARFRDDAPRRSIKYHRATEVLRAVTADSGPIGELLVVATRSDWTSEDDRLEAARALRAKVTEMRRDDVAAAAFKASHVKAFEIHSGAQRRLLGYWDEALGVVAEWAEAAVSLRRAKQADASTWQATVVGRLHDAQVSCRRSLDRVVAELESEDDPLTAARGAMCRRLLDGIRSLLEGHPATTHELPVNRALNVDLLAVPSVDLDADWNVVTGSLTMDELALLYESLSTERSNTLRAAFDERILAEDHVGTKLLLDQLAHELDGPVEDRTIGLGEADLDVLAATDSRAEETARRLAVDLWKDTESLIAEDARLGYVDESTRLAWTERLYVSDPSDRSDIRVCRRAIEQLRDESARNRDDQTEEVRAEIAAAAHDEPRIAAALDRILGRVDAGDLATAWEYMSLAREGQAIPEAGEDTPDITVFFPDRDRELTEGVSLRSRTVAAAAADGQRIHGLDFSGLSSADRESASAGLIGWRAMSNIQRPGKDYSDWASHLPVVLSALGVTARFERNPLTGDREHDRVWVDLVGMKVIGDPVVPAFAPNSPGRGRLRLLAIAGALDPGQLEAAVDRDRSNDPVVVFHFGPLGPDSRIAVSDRLRAVGRAVVVIDDNVFGHLMATRPRRYEDTMRLVLPFATTNPYYLDVSGLVPETMFFGRRAELAAVMDRYGTCYLFGGRQLGKSALLRHAERQFNASDVNHVAVYVDLKGEQVGMPRPPEAVFEVLWPRLAKAGILTGEMPAHRVGETVADAIDTWLEAVPGRRLLVLLDECDNYLKTDAARDLTTSARLKELMERTDRGCKVVFAGLHTVQRFAGVANTPMAHLGTPIAIGPLEGGAAAELITKPLSALGYRFSDPELVNRILAHTSRQPALLVIFCHHLLRKLLSRPRRPGEPPVVITEADVDGTWADPNVSDAISERVRWTLALDPAYEVITYVIAYAAQGGRDHRIGLDELLRECQYWWPTGFADVSNEQFRLLADELIGLGVLARDGIRYGLRNPNVARLLGSEEEIQTRLTEAHTKAPDPVFEPSTWRRHVVGTSGTQFRSPLSDAQIDTLTQGRIAAMLVCGTSANGIDEAVATVEAATPARVKFTVRTWRDPIEPVLRPIAADRHRITIVDMRGANTRHARETLATIAAAVRPNAPRRSSGGTWSVVLVADVAADGALVRHISTLDSITPVPLQRWTESAITAYGRDAGNPFASPLEAGQVYERTGGWAYLVAEIAARAAGARTFASAIDQLDTSDLLARIGLDRDHVLAAAFKEVVGWARDADAGCDVETLSELLLDEQIDDTTAEAVRVDLQGSGLDTEVTGTVLVRQLVLADLLVIKDGYVWAEPVAAALLAGSPVGE